MKKILIIAVVIFAAACNPSVEETCVDTCSTGEQLCEDDIYMGCGINIETGCREFIKRADCLMTDQVCGVNEDTGRKMCIDPE